jgi:cytochrome c553
MRVTTIAISAWTLSIVVVPIAAPQDHAAVVIEGSAAFKRVGCTHCHTVRGVGTAIAPDLSRIGARYDAAYLERWLRDPREVRPSAHMPTLELSEDDIRALAAYLASQR